MALMNRLKNLAVIIGLIIGTVTLGNFISNFFQDDLVASARGGSFSLPPALEEHYDAVGKELSDRSLKERDELLSEVLGRANQDLDHSDREIASLQKQFLGERAEREDFKKLLEAAKIDRDLWKEKLSPDAPPLTEQQIAERLQRIKRVEELLAEVDGRRAATEVTEVTGNRLSKDDFQSYLTEWRLSYTISPPNTLTSLKSYWNIEISNKSGTSRNEVELYFPGAKYFTLFRDGGNPVSGRVDELISIGRMRPDEQLLVTLWSTDSEPLITPRAFVSPKARVTHTTGLATISFPREVTGMFVHAVDWAPFLVTIVLMVLVFVLSFATVGIIHKARGYFAKASKPVDPVDPVDPVERDNSSVDSN